MDRGVVEELVRAAKVLCGQFRSIEFPNSRIGDMRWRIAALDQTDAAIEAAERELSKQESL